MTQRLAARDLSGNGPSALNLSQEVSNAIKIFDTAVSTTGKTYYARDFSEADTFVIDVTVGSGDTVVLETRSSDAGSWGTEQTWTASLAYDFTATEQFRLRRTAGSGGSLGWLTPRKD